MLAKTIEQDIITAMKDRNKNLTTILRMVKADIQMEELNLKRELTDDEVITIIGKQIKGLKESITEFAKGNRDDLIKKAEAEMKVLQKYMPKPLTDAEVVVILDEALEKVKPSGMQDMGLLMKEITPKVKGKYDMAKLSKLVKEKLTSAL